MDKTTRVFRYRMDLASQAKTCSRYNRLLYSFWHRAASFSALLALAFLSIFGLASLVRVLVAWSVDQLNLPVHQAIIEMTGFAGLIAGWFLFARIWPLMNRQLARWMSRVEIDSTENVEVELTHDGLLTRSPGMRTSIDWDAISLVAAIDGGLMIGLGYSAIFVPACVFASPNERDEVLEKILSSLPDQAKDISRSVR